MIVVARAAASFHLVIVVARAAASFRLIIVVARVAMVSHVTKAFTMTIRPEDLAPKKYNFNEPATASVTTLRKILESPTQDASRKVRLLLRAAVGNPRLLVEMRDLQITEQKLAKGQLNESLWARVGQQLAKSSKQAKEKTAASTSRQAKKGRKGKASKPIAKRSGGSSGSRAA